MIDELLYSQNTDRHNVTVACFGWSLEEGLGFLRVSMWPSSPDSWAQGSRCPTVGRPLGSVFWMTADVPQLQGHLVSLTQADLVCGRCHICSRRERSQWVTWVSFGQMHWHCKVKKCVCVCLTDKGDWWTFGWTSTGMAEWKINTVDTHAMWTAMPKGHLPFIFQLSWFVSHCY